MTRWYDYIVAILAADMITHFLFSAANATEWWHPILYGFLAGFIYNLWTSDYCRFRLEQENKK